MVKGVIRAPKFIQQVKKIDRSYLERIQKIITKIINNLEIGKPMRYNRKGTRELYLTPLRISYMYDSKTDVLYFLDIYHKNQQ